MKEARVLFFENCNNCVKPIIEKKTNLRQRLDWMEADLNVLRINTQVYVHFWKGSFV